MNKDFNNIEDLFKDKLDGVKLEPSSNIWDKLDSELSSNAQFEAAKSKLEGIKLQPGSNVWNAIQRKLRYLGFIKFNPTSFNVYYLSAVVAALVTVGGYIGFNDENINVTKIVAENSVLELPIREITTEKLVEQEILEDNIQPIKQQKKIVNNIIIAEDTGIEKSVDNKSLEPKDIFADNDIVEDIKKEAEIIVPPVVVENEVSNIYDVEKENEILVTENDDNENVITPEIIEDNNEENIDQLFISDKVEQEIDEKEEIKEIEKTIDTISYHVVDYYEDTLGIDAKGDPIVVETTVISVEVYASSMVNTMQMSATSPEFEEYVNLRNSAESPEITYSFGANFNYSFKNILLQTGLAYTQLGERGRYGERILDINEAASYWDYNTYNYTETNEVQILDLNHYLSSGGEEQFINHEYEATLVGIDSTEVITYDTTISKQYEDCINKYSYIEVPFMVGYEIKSKKMSWTLKAGIISGVFIGAKGNTYSITDSDKIVSIESENIPFKRFNFSGAIGLSANYFINRKTSVLFEPYYRKNLKSIIDKDYSLSQKYSSVGVKLGLKYYF